mmetsp:Transcript_2135/g.4910  ORF Transcript_2135/g.4910 Transcript_2135/m.4910 type:complete len:211 (-) Transcript_2135:287-919(-)
MVWERAAGRGGGGTAARRAVGERQAGGGGAAAADGRRVVGGGIGRGRADDLAQVLPQGHADRRAQDRVGGEVCVREGAGDDRCAAGEGVRALPRQLARAGVQRVLQGRAGPRVAGRDDQGHALLHRPPVVARLRHARALPLARRGRAHRRLARRGPPEGAGHGRLHTDGDGAGRQHHATRARGPDQDGVHAHHAREPRRLREHAVRGRGD